MPFTVQRLSRAARLAGVAAASAVAAVPAAPAAAYTADELTSSLAGTHRAMGTSAGALVVDLETGKTIFSRRATSHRIPASNEKLFTTAAALLRLGPSARLETVIHTPGADPSRTGTVPNLHIVGGGDPALDDAALKRLVSELREAGLRRVRGGILADESLFDSRRGGPDSRYRPDRYLGGWLGALTWAHGRPDYSEGPALKAAERLHSFLKEAGVKIGRSPQVRALPRADAALETPAARAESPPMRTLVRTTNRPSDNFYAEMLAKGLGARFGSGGTTARGMSVVRRTLKDIDVEPRKLRDGSGLSRENRTSPREVMDLLRHMHELRDEDDGITDVDRPGDDLGAQAAADGDTRGGAAIYDAWRTSLAVAGRSGTLRKRMRDTAAEGRCRAKTGTLREVSALAGYCETRGGRDVAFVFLENRVNTYRAKKLEDRMVARIARYEP